MKSKHVGVKDSNEAEVFIVWEAISLYSLCFVGSLIIEKLI